MTTIARPDAAATPRPLRSQVRDAVERAWARAVAAGALPALPDDQPAVDVEVVRPAHPEHGDLATSLALKLARPYRRPPMAIATAITAELQSEANAPGSASPIAGAEAAAPGFINVRLADRALEQTVQAIVANPARWGSVAPIRPRSVNVEFVSANPTGPLTIGNARGAFIGDLLSRVLEAGGQRVTREYYFNDVGGQIPNLGASIVALRRGEPIPDDGYHGAYVADLAAELPDDVLATATTPGADAAAIVGHWAAGRVREGIEASLAALGVRFDVWKSEASLHSEGWVERAIERLRERGHVYEEEGALWFRSTAFGDDKDRVIIRSNGQPTYFAADIGYVTEKLSRGFDHLIYVWGADHHGTVARLRNAAEAMGYDREAVQVLLYSWVRFVREGVEISMSKRAGEFITLDELLAEVGVDAARWFFASRAATTGIDFDIELAKRQSSENPVYYVQYAHARIASILRKAADSGLAPAPSIEGALADPPEASLARAVARLPEVVEDAVAAEETHGVTAYATELATTFHAFYRDARVVEPAEPERSARRLALAEATRITLARALGLLGISAPESM
ncbi:MAG TPA: arginine--tRNA ligase [Candidatus Limnocylindrales bacterium]|nr:arginine--tRNA ligase [Candidatus Limnocylindrales bacterium]